MKKENIVLIVFIGILCLLFINKNTFMNTSSSDFPIKIMFILLLITLFRLNIIYGCIGFIFVVIFYKYIITENFIDIDIDKTTYLDGIDVIYWINLDRSKDRRKKMEKLLEDPLFKKMDKVRIPAVDGKDPDFEKNIDNIITNRDPKNTNLEYGCTLSHLNAIKKFYDSEYDIALILEDDITLDFKKYWKTEIKNVIKNAPQDWEIIQLCYTLKNNKSIPKATYTKTYGNFYSTVAYIINKKGASKINNIYLNNKYHFKKSIIHAADWFIYLLCKSYTFKFPYFTYSYENDSVIHNDHLPSHIKSKMHIENYLQSITSFPSQTLPFGPEVT